MSNTYLLVNAGSSSLKVSLACADSNQQMASAQVDWSESGSTTKFYKACEKSEEAGTFRDHAAALLGVLLKIRGHFPNITVKAVAHRVVHGGDLKEGALITTELLASLNKLSPLAPLHNPPSLAAIAAARKEFIDIPHVAIFDTAFHRNMLEEAAQYAIPQKWTKEWGIKRYGFHGLSHSYCAQRASEILDRPLEKTKVIVCHLGHGCSASAVSGGRCLDTTMGFTPLEGLMMATRCGNIDAGAVLYAQRNFNLNADDVSSVLNKQSGLLGVSGISSDLRQILVTADQGNASAKLAIAMFCYSVQKAIASLMVPLKGADALVFTAGIGENSAIIRKKICEGISFLGFEIDASKNEIKQLDVDISSTESKARILVIATREDMSMIRELKDVLAKLA